MDGVETRWVWSGDTVLHETKTGHADVTWYHHPDRFAPLAKTEGDQTSFAVSDHLGTPTAMYDGAGKLAWRMQLDLFGVPKEGSFEGGDVCPWRWPGQYEDREIGLYYNRFRYYDPTLGQYISQDPIGLKGGIATYAYVRSPTTWKDPLGLSGCSDGGKTTALVPYWPPDNGFIGHHGTEWREPGELLNRYGGAGGRFVAPAGTPYPMRSLPPGSGARPLHTYQVNRPVQTDTGAIAPAFGEIGFGKQHMLPKSAQDLIDEGFLVEVKI
jgi:RHS repeat-associated protein